jgi:hypothetical protein
MRRSDMSAELFLPLGNAEWKGRRWDIRRGERVQTDTDITGVRLRPADPRGEDLAPERQVQGDLVNLVATLRKLRAVDGGDGVVLSRRFLTARPGGESHLTRVRFGLEDRRADDVAAARASHRRIRKAIAKSRLVVQHPKERFDANTGLDGLERWGAAVRLRRRRRWWLALLPLLLLLLLLLPDAPAAEPERFFGVPIETSSLVILLDKSSSMAPHFGAVRDEARRVLGRMIDAGGDRWCNVIAYDAGAKPAFDGLRRVDDASSVELHAFLDRLRAGGGTNLRAGVEAAAEQVAAHGKPTTLLILTDAQDNSIQQMLAAKQDVLDRFQGVRIVGHALTPRLFGERADAHPQTPQERGLARLSAAFHGRFGAYDPE